MACGIYKITCKETGRCYIGQSKNIEKRWKIHNKKYSPQLFDYEVLVTCPFADLNELEILMIETFDSHRNGFNRTIGGTSIKTLFPDAERNKKVSEARKGNQAGKANKGRKHTEESRKNMSKGQLGNKNAAGGKGKILSQETRMKMSEARMGKKRGPYKKKLKDVTNENG